MSKNLKYYEYRWAPVSGNVLYLMPQVGTKVSLYFGDWCESGGKAVNCVRMNGGADAPAMANYEERELLTEHGKTLELHPSHILFKNSPEDKYQNSLKIDGPFLDGAGEPIREQETGIFLETSGSIAMTATEGILIEGKELLKIHGEEGVYNYHGEVQVKEKAEEAEGEGEPEGGEAEKTPEQAARMKDEADRRNVAADEIEGKWKETEQGKEKWIYPEAQYLAADEQERAAALIAKETELLTRSGSAFVQEDMPKDTEIDLYACFTLEHSMVTYISKNYGGQISFIASKGAPCLDRFEDYTAKYYFDWYKFTGRVIIGVAAVAGGVIIIIYSGGAALPAAASIVGQAMIAGGTTVLLISASDCERGVLTESDELFTALSRAVIVALITGGLGNAVGTASAVVNESVKGFVRYLIVGALTLGVSGVSTAITDTIYDQEWSWERALQSGIFDLAMAWLAMGLKDAGKAANAAEDTRKIPTEAELNEAAQEWSKMQKDLAPSKNKANNFNTGSVVYDAETGQFYYGMNKGIQISGDELNSELSKLFPESSLNQYKIGNCAEVDAVNQALNSGSNIADLYIYTIETTSSGFGMPKPACENCIYTFKGNVADILSGF